MRVRACTHNHSFTHTHTHTHECVCVCAGASVPTCVDTCIHYVVCFCACLYTDETYIWTYFSKEFINPIYLSILILVCHVLGDRMILVCTLGLFAHVFCCYFCLFANTVCQVRHFFLFRLLF